MPTAPLRERIVEQFSYGGDRADVWRAFDRILDTDAYLNLGYSPWYLPHVVGSSQRRLANVVADGLTSRLGETAGLRLLDAGCGRGGPAVVFAGGYGFDVIGVDLVRFNVAAARRNAAREAVDASFVVGDAESLPVATDSVAVATAIDSLVYVPQEQAVFDEFARVLQPGGIVAITDLLATDGGDCLEEFADAWDMPELPTRRRYLEEMGSAGLDVHEVHDLSQHSVGRFRKWTRAYLAIADRWPGLVEQVLARWDLDADRVTRQVRSAHDALPYLRHVLVHGKAP